MPKVSVIVPVYNAGKWLNAMLNCLVNQTLEDIEFIIVNDGSTDNSSDIIKLYFDNYPKKFKVLNQENKGQSAARNLGIECAQGEYIGFIDADDEITYDMFEKLYKKAVSDNFDIVTCGVRMIYPNKEIIVKTGVPFDTNNIKAVFNSMYVLVTNKIYKKTLFNGNLRFKEGYLFEDVIFNYMILPKVLKMGIVEEPLYYYYKREGSTSMVFDERLYQIINNWDIILDYYRENNLYDEYLDLLEYSYVRYSFATFIKRLAKCGNRKEFKNGLKHAITKVRKNFPNYKNNPYFKGLKGFYLKRFNFVIGWIIYIINK